VVILLLLLLQAGVLARDQVLVTHAAREAARVAALDDDRGAIEKAATEAGPLVPQHLTVGVEGRGAPGSRVTIEITYRAATQVPLIGRLVSDVDLHARASMRVER
jgi:hypothetical protein